MYNTGNKTTTYKSSDEDVNVSHSRRSSEKVKKRMKMADLKAFVETKLLSKSEKTLEKIGRDETKASSMFEQVQIVYEGEFTCNSEQI